MNYVPTLCIGGRCRLNTQIIMQMELSMVESRPRATREAPCIQWPWTHHSLPTYPSSQLYVQYVDAATQTANCSLV